MGREPACRFACSAAIGAITTGKDGEYSDDALLRLRIVTMSVRVMSLRYRIANYEVASVDEDESADEGDHEDEDGVGVCVVECNGVASNDDGAD